MKKIDVTAKQMESIIRSQERGVSWVQTGKDAGVPRRVAQRAYKEWERKHRTDELKEVRRELALEDLREHREQVIEIAQDLVEITDISTLPILEGTAEDRLSSLLTKNRWVVEGEEGIIVTGTVSNRVLSDRQVKLQNEILLKSLKTHTREKVNWGTLEVWQTAYDECSQAMDIIKEEIRNQFEEKLKIHPGLKDGIKESETKEVIAKSVETVSKLLWCSSLSGKLELLASPPSNTIQEPDFIITSLGEGKQIFRIPWNTNFPKDILEETLNDIAKQLYGDESFRVIKDTVDIMNQSFSELEESLNPLALKLLILSTSCELCPV